MDSGVNPGVDVYLAKQIESAIADDERTAELGVTVDVRAGKVFLRGKVSTARRREAAAGVAGERAPGHEVVNEIQVEDPADGAASTTAEERIR